VMADSILPRDTGKNADFDLMLGHRVRSAREESRMSQAELSGLLGFENRQVLSNIESGKRKLGVDELLKLMQLLRKELEYFTDPLRPVGEQISWRADARAGDMVFACKSYVGGIVAAYRAFANQLGEPVRPPHIQLAVSKRSSLEEVANAAERLADNWNLAPVPAQSLPKAIEQRLGVPVLYVDTPPAISGAATKMADLAVILINRNEPLFRQVYDVAHELFHVLTWEKMPPKELDAVQEKKSRIEQFADAFAGALLMPRAVIEPFREFDSVIENPPWSDEAGSEGEFHSWINGVARKLAVSSEAVYYRFKNLGWLDPREALHIDFERLKWQGRQPQEVEKPKLYSEKFVDMLHRMLDGGRISVRRAARLLNCTIEDLAELFRSYGRKVPFPSES